MRPIRWKGYQTAGMAIAAACAVTIGACGGGSTPSPTNTVAPVRSGVPSLPTSTPRPGATSKSDSSIIIQQPPAAAAVAVPFSVSGTADVFEGTLVVQVLDANGKTLCERQVQATSGTGTPGTWQTTMAFAPPVSTVPATVRAFSRSAKDGSEEGIVTRPIQVSGAVPAVVISEPSCNRDIQALTTLDVRGTARAFEATLTVELRDGAGKALLSRIVTAAEAGPVQAPWQTSFDLAGVSTGLYELVAFTTSAEDGSPANIFAIPVRIST